MEIAAPWWKHRLPSDTTLLRSGGISSSADVGRNLQPEPRDGSPAVAVACRFRPAASADSCCRLYELQAAPLPGIAPMWVLRWPRISASSFRPSSSGHIRPSADDGPLQSRVFLHRRNTTRQMNLSLDVRSSPRTTPESQDTLLDFLQAVVVCIQPIRSLLRCQHLSQLLPGSGRWCQIGWSRTCLKNTASMRPRCPRIW